MPGRLPDGPGPAYAGAAPAPGAGGGPPAISVADFAAQLRELREHAGRPSYRRLAQLAHYSHTALSQAASGRSLPSLGVTQAFVRACGGDVNEWSARWHEADPAARPPGMPPCSSDPGSGGAEPGGVRTGPAEPGRLRSGRRKQPGGVTGWQTAARWLRARKRLAAAGIATAAGIAALVLWAVGPAAVTSLPGQARPELQVESSGLYVRYAMVTNLGNRAGYAYVINTGDGRVHRSPQPVQPGQFWEYSFNRALKDGVEICGFIGLGPATCADVHAGSQP